MASPSWLVAGNAGTDPANDFLGTSDNTPLRIGTAGAQRIFIDTTGNMGFNTTSPRSVLEIVQTGSPVAFTLTNSGSGTAAIDFNTALPAAAGTYNPYARIQALDDGNSTNAIQFLVNAPGAPNNGLVEIMRVTGGGGGTVGITGSMNVSQDATIQGNASVAGNINVSGDVLLTGADCAEEFELIDGECPEPGTVVVIDQEGALRESCMAYDKKVAGVISGAGNFRHALVLDRRISDKQRTPIALIGKVYCKVDADISPIETGDLLTTCATRGHAMKANEPSRAFGSIIGKALQSLGKGKGLIPIMVTLQ